MLQERKGGILVTLLFLLLLTSCGQVPTTQPPEPQRVEPGDASPTSTSRPPTRTPTPRPRSTSTATPTATHTELPQIPDFSSLLDFGGGGGGGACFGVPDEPLPAVEGGLPDFNETDLPRSAMLCIWGAPFDTLLHVTLTSPGGSTTLQADVLAQSQDETVHWLGGYVDEATSFAVVDYSGTRIIYLEVWWPRGLETGKWHVDVRWDGGEVEGLFDAKESQRPEISMVHSRSATDLLPGRCLQLQDADPRKVSGEKFIPNEPAYLLVYRNTQADRDLLYSLYEVKQVTADRSGSFETELSKYYASGAEYLLVGVNDPGAKMTTENDHLLYRTIADATDCFTVADKRPYSCPGAPPQRMRVSQRGIVCTAEEAVLLRFEPFRSAATIDLLPVGSRFTVLEGPSCADDWSWWLVQTEAGDRGWIAEGGDEIDPYFICPLQ